jgi:hypothetical protein
MSTMTLTEAYDKLHAQWLGTFSVDLVVWHYEHLPHDPPSIHYRIWNAARSRSYEGPTLDVALTLALAESDEDDIQAADRAREGLQVESEILPGIPLTVVKS